MTFDLSLPIYAASGLTLLAAFTYFGWPRIQLRTYNKIYGGLRVLEIALILSRSARAGQPATGSATPTNAPPAAEFVIYVTLKTGNL
jgi:hypothetical protein